MGECMTVVLPLCMVWCDFAGCISTVCVVFASETATQYTLCWLHGSAVACRSLWVRCVKLFVVQGPCCCCYWHAVGLHFDCDWVWPCVCSIGDVYIELAPLQRCNCACRQLMIEYKSTKQSRTCWQLLMNWFDVKWICSGICVWYVSRSNLFTLPILCWTIS